MSESKHSSSWSTFSWERGNPRGERRHRANDARNDENPRKPSSVQRTPPRPRRARAATSRGGDCRWRRGREAETVLLRQGASLLPASCASPAEYSPGGGVPYRFAAAARSFVRDPRSFPAIGPPSRPFGRGQKGR